MPTPISTPAPTAAPTMAAAQLGQKESSDAAAGLENERRTSAVDVRTQARKLNSLIVVPFEVSNPPKTFYPGFRSRGAPCAGRRLTKTVGSMRYGSSFVNSRDWANQPTTQQ